MQQQQQQPAAAAGAAAANGAQSGHSGGLPAPLQALQQEELRDEAQGRPDTAATFGSGSNGTNGSSSSSSSKGESCCSQVYAERQAAFKSHPAAEEMRQQRLEMNSIIRSGARAELLRQLRAETERQLRQQEELLQQQQLEEDASSQVQQRRHRNYSACTPGEGMKASLECMDGRPLQQLITQPQTLYELPEDLKSGEPLLLLLLLLLILLLSVVALEWGWWLSRRHRFVVAESVGCCCGCFNITSAAAAAVAAVAARAAVAVATAAAGCRGLYGLCAP